MDEALLDAARLEPDDDVLVLGGVPLALGAQKRLQDGWVYVVRREVDELEELLREAHAADATGIAYLVGEAPVLPLLDHAVAVAVGRVGSDDVAAAELARVLVTGGRVALAEPERPAADALAAALESAGFGEVTVTDAGGETIVSGTLQ